MVSEWDLGPEDGEASASPPHEEEILMAACEGSSTSRLQLSAASSAQVPFSWASTQGL